MKSYFHPLMDNNIIDKDVSSIISFLKKNKKKIFTQSNQVRKFEEEWSKWLGCKYSIFVNSGSSANLISMLCLKILLKKEYEIIVPTLTWISDIASVIQNNFKPVFADINMKNLCIDENEIYKKVTKNTKAVFLTHVQGFNGLSKKLLNFLKKKKIMLIEDVCESHGAKFQNKKLGTYGKISNFSFYYAHHITTIEGGMISTNSKQIDILAKMKRGHGLLRDSQDPKLIKKTKLKYKDLNSDFIFLTEGFNFRSNELSAVIGLEQIKRLNRNIKIRNDNHKLFLKNLRKDVFMSNFDLIGSSNYGLHLIMKEKNKIMFKKVTDTLSLNSIEYRIGSAGGGNQLRQPYLKNLRNKFNFKNLQNTEHMHFYSLYIGNYPDLDKTKILKLCTILNKIKF